MISWWFKTKACFVFCHQLFIKLSRVRGKEHTWFRENIFTFEFFRTLENFWKFSNRICRFFFNKVKIRNYVFIVQTSFAGLTFLLWLLARKLFLKTFRRCFAPCTQVFLEIAPLNISSKIEQNSSKMSLLELTFDRVKAYNFSKTDFCQICAP